MTNEAVLALLKKNPISVGCGLLALALGGWIYFRSDAIPAAEAELAEKQAESERLATNLKYSAQLKEQLDKLVAANKETSQAAVEVARKWAAANPMADMVKKGYEAMQPAAKTAKKEKAAV